MRLSWLAYAAALLGLALVLIGSLMDVLGFGGSPGIGANQLLAIAAGWTLFVFGGAIGIRLRRDRAPARPLGRRALTALAVLAAWILPLAAGATAWLRYEARSAAAGSDSEERAMQDQLISIGYLDWSENTADPADNGVRVWDRERAMPGYTLITSRERPEVYLIDLSGRVVHAWSIEGTVGNLEGTLLLANGDLLVLSKFSEVARLDWNSNVVWRTALEAHHDITLMPDGHFYAWVREIIPFWGLDVRFPFLAKLTQDGEVVGKWSTYEELPQIKRTFDQRSFLDGRLFELHRNELVQRIQDRVPEGRTYDFFHPNTVQWIGPNANDTHRPFRSGNILICLRNVHQIATIDPETGEILWVWGEGELQSPHHPTMLANGNILMFDNGTVREATRVVELNPVTEQIEWQYPADVHDPDHHFYSPSKGSSQRLANGNTLIGDGDNGRSVEVTPDGEIVWEFFYPEINEAGQRAAIYRSIRYPADLIEGLLEEHGANLDAAPAW